MAKQAQAAERYRIWAFGCQYQFQVVTLDIAMNAACYGGNAANPIRRQKRQIVLHCTTGNSTAEQLLANWFNSPGNVHHVSSHFIIEQAWHGQIARAAAPAGVDNDDGNFVDAVRLVPHEDMITNHAGGYNTTSIGIEITNIATNWHHADRRLANEPSYQRPAAHNPICPVPVIIGGDSFCGHGLPQDDNRYYRMPAGGPYGGVFQAYDEEQYATLILLLRYLCIRYRIPRQFIGPSDTAAGLRRYRAEPTGAGAAVSARRRANNSDVYHFAGILFHRNVSMTKSCPGPLHRNRLFRGLIDEWWLPVQLDGTPREYYSGPFYHPGWAGGNPTANALFVGRPQATPPVAPRPGIAVVGGTLVGTTLSDAQIDGLIESKSYFNLNNVEDYFRAVETRDGGSFPVGTNKVWHGGVHFRIRPEYPFVFAAACGTIVAARLSSHSGTERHPKFGSQRFVLVRHAAYLDTENDPDGVGDRIQYSLDNRVLPRYVFSLYMHLSEVADLANEHEQNPPWFNRWRASNPAIDIGLRNDKGIVFNPDIKVSVGDILGKVGTFRGQPTLHFEILTHRNTELAMVPWNDPNRRAVDNDANVMCDAGSLDRFLQDAQEDGIDTIDVLRAAPELRNVKALHKSEWALSAVDQIRPLIPGERRRRAYWAHFDRCSWVADAVAANADLTNQLGDANGMFWHYHPITFMQKVNTLIAGENRELSEEQYTGTNVKIDEDGYFTEFIEWSAAAGAFQPSRADNANVRAELVTPADSDPTTPGIQTPTFRFTRRNIACQRCVAAAAGPEAMPVRTKIAVGLLDLLERVRRHYNSPLTVEQSYICNNCGILPGNPCCTRTVAGLDAHGDGCAVDIRPTVQSAANCRRLWDSATATCNAFNTEHQETCGSPSGDSLPPGYNRVEWRAYVQDAAGNPQQQVPPVNPTPAQAASFQIHMSLVPAPAARPEADRWLTPVKLRLRFVDLLVMDDQDCFGEGEWKLDFFVNGRRFKTFDRSVSTGDRISLDWVDEVELRDDQELRLSIRGKDVDLLFDDSLGEVRVTYSRRSAPAWGLGTRPLRSSNGSFEITVTIESAKLDY